MAELRGITMYFDMIDLMLMRPLTPDDTVALLKALLDYAQFGIVPEFTNELCTFAWSALRPRVDASIASYQKSAEQKRFGGLLQAWKRSHPGYYAPFSSVQEWQESGSPELSEWTQGTRKEPKEPKKPHVKGDVFDVIFEEGNKRSSSL